MRFARVVMAALLAGTMLMDASAAQRVEVRRSGHGTARLDATIDRVLADQTYRILTNDTLIARDAVLAGPILTLGNRLVIEGKVNGDLVIVDANVYVRPTAVIEGRVTNIGGGFYRSENAVLRELIDHPLAPYHVERNGDAMTIVGDVEDKFFKFNFKAPRANRVDGVRPSLGATLTFPSIGRNVIELVGWGGYAFEREQIQGGGELRLTRGLTQFRGGFEKNTATNDDWIRSDINNSLSFMFQGKDYRNYYDVEQFYGVVSRELNRGGHQAVLSIRAQREKGTSLRRGDPWVLFEPDGDTLRTNPLIDDAVISSGILNLRGEWIALTTAAEYDASIEIARDGIAGGDLSFNAFEIWAEWAMQALANHTLEFETRLHGPLPGTDALPRQRWGMLGGSSTLYTFEVGEFFGDRVAYFQSEYSIPMPPKLRLPYIGSPALEFLHAIGMAWTTGQDHRFEQNLGVRLQFPFVYARVVTNPRDIDDTKYTVGVSFPKSAYPWEKRAQDAARNR